MDASANQPKKWWRFKRFIRRNQSVILVGMSAISLTYTIYVLRSYETQVLIIQTQLENVKIQNAELKLENAQILDHVTAVGGGVREMKGMFIGRNDANIEQLLKLLPEPKQKENKQNGY